MQTPVTNHVFSSTEVTRRRQSTYDPQYGCALGLAFELALDVLLLPWSSSHHNGLGESMCVPATPLPRTTLMSFPLLATSSFPPSPTGSAETSYHTGVYTSFGTASYVAIRFSSMPTT